MDRKLIRDLYIAIVACKKRGDKVEAERLKKEIDKVRNETLG